MAQKEAPISSPEQWRPQHPHSRQSWKVSGMWDTHHHKLRGVGLHHSTEGGVVTARGPSSEGDCISLCPDSRATDTVQQTTTSVPHTLWKDWRLQLFCSFQIDSLIKA